MLLIDKHIFLFGAITENLWKITGRKCMLMLHFKTQTIDFSMVQVEIVTVPQINIFYSHNRVPI